VLKRWKGKYFGDLVIFGSKESVSRAWKSQRGKCKYKKAALIEK
jgi:hypothetical protein